MPKEQEDEARRLDALMGGMVDVHFPGSSMTTQQATGSQITSAGDVIGLSDADGDISMIGVL